MNEIYIPNNRHDFQNRGSEEKLSLEDMHFNEVLKNNNFCDYSSEFYMRDRRKINLNARLIR